MEQAAVRLKKGEGRSFKAGGPWIYDNEIDLLTGPWENGGLVHIEDYNGYVLGHGFVNTNSAITVSGRPTFCPAWWWTSSPTCWWWSPWPWASTG